MSKLSYSIAEAAAATGFHQRRISDAIKNNELGYLQHGRAKVISVAALKRWLDTLQPGRD